jgi:hypothetical protein
MQGKKMLSFFFGLGEDIAMSLHQTIKSAMPFGHKTVLADYGDVRG